MNLCCCLHAFSLSLSLSTFILLRVSFVLGCAFYISVAFTSFLFSFSPQAENSLFLLHVRVSVCLFEMEIFTPYKRFTVQFSWLCSVSCSTLLLLYIVMTFFSYSLLVVGELLESMPLLFAVSLCSFLCCVHKNREARTVKMILMSWKEEERSWIDCLLSSREGEFEEMNGA